ncbi:hypothetical protein Tco_0034535, partial [Tanacetum coccineum]
ECRALRNQGNRNRDTPRRIVLVETLANALVVQDRIGLSSSSISDSELADALKEKDDLKLKLEKFETSSMKLTKLINSQISVNNKSGVGFDSQMNENELHDCHLNKGKVFESASDSSVNEIEDENTRKSVIEQHTYRHAKNLRKSQSHRVDKRNWNGIMTQKLGNGFEFIKKACFVCGSFNHLIKDGDFHDNKMVEKSALINMRRVTSQRKVKLVWNNA